MKNYHTLINYIGQTQCSLVSYQNEKNIICGTISLSTGSILWQENLDQKRAHTLIDHLQKHIEHLDALESQTSKEQTP